MNENQNEENYYDIERKRTYADIADVLRDIYRVICHAEGKYARPIYPSRKGGEG